MMAAAPTLPYATSVEASPGALPTHRELRRMIAMYEHKVYTLQIELARYESSAMYVTDAMHGALEASKLEHALRALQSAHVARLEAGGRRGAHAAMKTPNK